MANTYPKILKAGTYANYQALATKDSNVLYFCTDNGKLFKGTVDFTNSLEVVTAATLPATGVPGKIYYESDTGAFKAYLNNAYVVIGTPTDASSSGDTTISSSSDDAHVPTSLNVYLYGQDILSQAIGGTDVVKSVVAGDDPAELVVTQGDDTASDIVVPGVVVGVAQKANTPGTIEVSTSDGATATDVTLAGVALEPTWVAATRTLTIPVAGGSDVVVDIGKDIFVDPAAPSRYDETTDQIIIYLNDGDPGYLPEYDATATYSTGDQIHRDDAGTEYVYTANQDIDTPEEWTAAHWTKGDEYVAPTEIDVPVQGMVPVYSGGSTTTATVNVSGTTITAAVKVDQHTGNAITIASDTEEGGVTTTGGLRVDLSSYATQSDLTTLQGTLEGEIGAVDDKADANAEEIAAIYAAWGGDSFDPAP